MRNKTYFPNIIFHFIRRHKIEHTAPLTHRHETHIYITHCDFNLLSMMAVYASMVTGAGQKLIGQTLNGTNFLKCEQILVNMDQFEPVSMPIVYKA